MKPSAVIFDLYETLISEFDAEGRISKRNVDYMALLGLSNDQFKREWGSRQMKRMTGVLGSYTEVIKDILQQLNLPFPDAAVHTLHEARAAEKRLPFRQISPNVIALLDQLKAQQIKLGLISNCTSEEIEAWQQSELAGYFDDVIFSFEVGLAKPDERIYSLSCERLNVQPSDAVFVGDGGSLERTAQGMRE